MSARKETSGKARTPRGQGWRNRTLVDRRFRSLGALLALKPAERAIILATLSPRECEELYYDWSLWGRSEQKPPPGDWIYWLILAGRGAGKTRAGAEAVREWTKSFAIVNLIGATHDDVRDIMVLGESGLMAICPPGEQPRYARASARLSWPNGAVSQLFSAEEPDRLRGKQHMKLWCLSGDTNVSMSDGSTRKIADIRPGDYVATRAGAKPVIGHALTNRNAAVLRLEALGGQTLIGTAEHPVWIDGRGFMPLGSVAPGMPICVTLATAGTPRQGVVFVETIVSVEQLPARREVFDIAVDGNGEFFANGILVHNCDELAAWRYPDTFEQALLGLRLGDKPQAVITTTPRPIKLIRQLVEDKDVIVTRGSTFDNQHHLAEAFLKRITARYEGRMIGRQELFAEIVEEAPGALWTRALIERQRLSPGATAAEYSEIVIGVDPPAKSGAKADECGILVVGRTARGAIHVLADLTSQGDTPGQWAARVAAGYRRFKANRIVAEINNGGDMVVEVLRQSDPNLPVRTVTATRGKFLRAEPVAAAYERGVVHHVGDFAKLEDQLCTLTPDFDARVSGFSPDRADALVWAIADLIAPDRAQPQALLDWYAQGCKTD